MESYQKFFEDILSDFIQLDNEDWFAHSVEGIGDINGDGTVSNFTKYGERLNDMNESFSIVVSSFGDSEFGFQRGSSWVLHLGNILFIEEVNTIDNNFIFPNPAKTSFSFLNSDTLARVELFSVDGREVASFNDITNNNFNISYVPVGTYLIVATDTDENTMTFKTSIQ